MKTNRKFTAINPATEQVINEYQPMSKDQINERVNKAKNAFQDWKKNSNRDGYLYAVAHIFRQDKERLARVITTEMGKAIKEARSEVEKCAWVMEYYADNGRIFVADEVVNTDARKSFIAFEPLGVIGSIMPWNFPYWQALRFAAPSLMVGNTIVLKPSSITLQCGIEIEKAFKKDGVPQGVFQTIIGNGTTAEMLIDSNVNAVTFTGSVEVGKKVAQRATSQLKKTVLELGGSDPFIVCEDADIEKASSGAVKGRFVNCGQSAIASKRFIITKKIANEFIEAFTQKTEKLKVGDPLSDETDIGPLVNDKSIENIDEVVRDSVKSGAELITGGERVDSKGYFYYPTLLRNVDQSMRIIQEEVFGPVAPISIVENEAQAINLANDSKFGLGASIWTRDLDKAERLSRLVESGIVTVNNVVISDPRVPFGGIKDSGFGRELSRYGMLEFANIKSVLVYDLIRSEDKLDTSIEKHPDTKRYGKIYTQTQDKSTLKRFPYVMFPREMYLHEIAPLEIMIKTGGHNEGLNISVASSDKKVGEVSVNVVIDSGTFEIMDPITLESSPIYYGTIYVPIQDKDSDPILFLLRSTKEGVQNVYVRFFQSGTYLGKFVTNTYVLQRQENQHQNQG